MQGNQQPPVAAPGNVNYPAIHAAFAQYKGQVGNAAPPMPQPQSHGPAHAMMTHAMSQVQTQPGEDHGSMIIRALSEHLKRTTPDVSAIHKPQHPPAAGSR